MAKVPQFAGEDGEQDGEVGNSDCGTAPIGAPRENGVFLLHVCKMSGEHILMRAQPFVNAATAAAQLV
jgi:hypothetical protein